MHKTSDMLRWIIGGAILTSGLIIASFGWISLANGSGQERFPVATNPLYLEECGACHLAYPPQLLPSESWSRIISGLDDHFGDNAELDPDSQQAISEYLAQASEGNYGFRKFMRKLDNRTPLRITELPYFQHEHDEIPRRLVADNPDVGSFSQCDSCHKSAAKGDFDDDRVSIPGFGRWDD